MTEECLKPIDVSKYKVTETGQVLKMTKDEMKNRISLALKDPTLQQGFEIICKENAELARNLEQTEKDLADYQFNYPTIKELQKENAELKECLTVGTNFDQKEQLRKAEDIIRSLYFIIQGRIDYEGNIPLEDEMYRAKQFLKESE